ncbi:MAG: ribosome silencing factor [Deltaproteobacteria bacterium]|nr:ribosome silencing factor [Deltaproteobacteria bacterium]MBW2676335.1 ribosome silencing factor [Deltaproteobacteria bacterium]
MTRTIETTNDPSIDTFVNAVLGKKAGQIVILDVKNMTTFADTFIICSARSNRQATAIAEFVSTYLKKQGKKVLNIEGKKEGHWVLMDYGDVIIHIFFEPWRSFYDLEGLWVDARRIRTKSLVEHEEKEGRNE